MVDNDTPEIRIHGLAVSPGIAVGPLLITGSSSFEKPSTYSISEKTIESEIERFEKALLKTRFQLLELQKQIVKDIGAKDAGIFDAHLLVLEDHAILEEVMRCLQDTRTNIEAVFYRVIRRYIEGLQKIDDPYLRERVVDVKDVAKRVIQNLDGSAEVEQQHPVASQKHILLSHDLTPSDTAEMNRNFVMGFVTEIGSATSHTAIIARSLGIPAVVGMHGLCASTQTGQTALLDGYNGMLILDPSSATQEEYKQLVARKGCFEEKLNELQQTASRTLDERRITLSANIEFAHEAPHTVENGAEGVGLYRTEFLYMDRQSPPSEEQQTDAYTTVAKASGEHGVIIRTLDIGGDKLYRHMQKDTEPNPFLGWRGIRVSLEKKEMFKTQLRSILKASAQGKVRVMYPLVSCLEELHGANAVLEECKQELQEKGIAFDEEIEVGTMIEVPSAVMVVDFFAAEVDFLSIGTNDLIQYTLAVDRVNEKVASLYQPTHPAILRMIQKVVQAAQANNIWAGICGEMASDIRLLPILVGLELDELSVGSAQIPQVKYALQKLHSGECKTFVEEMMSHQHADTILEASEAIGRRCYPDLFLL